VESIWQDNAPKESCIIPQTLNQMTDDRRTKKLKEDNPDVDFDYLFKRKVQNHNTYRGHDSLYNKKKKQQDLQSTSSYSPSSSSTTPMTPKTKIDLTNTSSSTTPKETPAGKGKSSKDNKKITPSKEEPAAGPPSESNHPFQFTD